MDGGALPDYLTIDIPKADKACLIRAQALAIMKSSAFIIKRCGGLVNEVALDMFLEEPSYQNHRLFE